MTSNTQTRTLNNSFWTKCIILVSFLFLSKLASANGNSLNATLNALDFDATQALINAIKQNKLDYLLNEKN
ncbi:hypothetical protein P20652_0302 [Pseudoalteromonas sp. BSi20652]|nr:hypothetical protein [Pseudoalteromonas sp. BSi20652]GAA58448.1 hypothetical protein P20652_0302 [Pseudoalteromonas sp. BSi20652]